MISTTWFWSSQRVCCGLALASLIACAAPPASAALVYVDATDDSAGNTTLANGDPLVANDTTGATTWRQRDDAAFGSNGNVFEGVEPSPVIKTSVTGLASGIYDVYVHFWDPQSTVEDWNVRAGFASDALILFSREGAAELADSSASVLANTLTYDTSPTTFGPNNNRDNLAGYLGQVTIVGGSLSVFVDDFGVTDVNRRTWYDGISYELVTAIPEPSSILMVGIVLSACWAMGLRKCA